MPTDKRVDIRPEGTDSTLKVIEPPEQANLPTVLPSTTRKADKRHRFTPGLLFLFFLLSLLAGGRDERNWLRPSLLLLFVLLAAFGGGYWWLHSRTGLPPGIALEQRPP